MISSKTPLETMAQRLKQGDLLSDSDFELLLKEIQCLDLSKRLPQEEAARIALFDSEHADKQFGRLPDFDTDLERRRSELEAWFSGVLRPQYQEEVDTIDDADDSSQDLEDLLEINEETGESRFERIMNEGQQEPIPESQILSPREEQDLFLAYNYARHKLAGLIVGEITLAQLRALKGDKLDELLRWTILATDVRDLLVEFHYRFIVRTAHAVRRRVMDIFSIRDICVAGIGGIKKAINTFDPHREMRLTGFCWGHVFGAIREWIDTQTNWTASTRPVIQEPLSGGALENRKREKIPDSEIIAGQQYARWSSIDSGSMQGPQPQTSTLLDNVSLREKALKLEEFIVISRIRKAAATASHTKDPIHEFITSLAKSNVLPDSALHSSIGADFAPSEWKLVCRRRMLMIALQTSARARQSKRISNA